MPPRIGSAEESKDKMMVTSHMDKMGFIVTFIENNGFLRVGTIGDFKLENVVNNLVVFENGTIGRLCSDKDKPSVNDLYIDLGVDSGAEALDKIKEGDVCILKGYREKFNDNIVSPGLNNSLGCYVLLKALEELSSNREDVLNSGKELDFVFATEKEVGFRGARAAAFVLNPMHCIVVDCEESDDNLGGKGKFKLDKGIGLHVIDKNLIVHHKIKQMLQDLCDSVKVEYQYMFSAKGTDGGTIHKELTGIKTGVVSIPVRYKDSSYEMASLNDINNAIKVIANLYKGI